MGNGTFQNFSREKGTLYSRETRHFTLWERFFHLGIGPFILLESDHLSSGNRTTYPLGFGTPSGKRDTVFSGIRTIYPLRIGNLGDEVQPMGPSNRYLTYKCMRFFFNNKKSNYNRDVSKQ